MTRVVQVDPVSPSVDDLAEAAEKLRAGELVAFPTETVYGLGANALDPEAVRDIFRAKGRPPTNPLIVHVASVDRARDLVTGWPDAAERLSEAFWPGPLTLVLPRADAIGDVVTAGLDTVGIRMPSHPVAKMLIELAGVPVAAPSANRYTAVSPTRAAHVVAGLGDRVKLVVDGGQTTVGLESTVVRIESDGTVTLLRSGMVSVEELEDVVKTPVRRATAAVDDGETRPSPGQSVRHYSPRATVVVAPPGALAGHAGEAVMAVVFEGDGAPLHSEFGAVVELPDDPREWARRLYELFWQADRDGYDVLVVEEPPDEPSWEAVRDRIRRAGTPE